MDVFLLPCMIFSIINTSGMNLRCNIEQSMILYVGIFSHQTEIEYESMNSPSQPIPPTIRMIDLEC